MQDSETSRSKREAELRSKLTFQIVQIVILVGLLILAVIIRSWWLLTFGIVCGFIGLFYIRETYQEYGEIRRLK